MVGELAGADWQRRGGVHFERNVLSHVPSSSMLEVGEDIKAIFKVRREKTARTLAEEFVELYGGVFRRRLRCSRRVWRMPSPTSDTLVHTTPGYARRTC